MKTFTWAVYFSQLLLVFLFSGPLRADMLPFVVETSLTTMVSDGRHAPFWLLSNREGRFLPEHHAAALDLALFSRPDTTGNIRYGYGLELFGRLSDSSSVHIHQAFAFVQWKDLLQFRAGRWTDVVGSSEPLLSTGSIIWSANARPMTQLEIRTPDYINVPYTRGYLEVKGRLSHGWFERDRYVEGVWMHHKNIYFRLGGNLPVNLTYGFNHYAQWAGQSPDYDKPFPSDLDAFYRIFFNRAGDDDDPATPPGWAINKFGNTLGSRSYGVDVTLNNSVTGVYMQDVFDDGSGLRRQNFPDGLWGAYLRFDGEKRLVQAIVYEFLHTKDQSGPTHNDPDGNVVGGNDNYFNHGQYRSGWTLYGFTIGTPLITSPILNDPPSRRFANNRVLAHHVGLEGHLANHLTYRGLFTYSRNYGRHSIPFDQPIDQLSMMLELARPIPGHNLEAGITLAADAGRMYGDNLGLLLSLRKHWP